MRRQSKNLIKRAWKEYKNWTKHNRDRFLDGVEITSYERFWRVWKYDTTAKSWVGKLQQIKSSSLYQSDDKTARHVQELIKRLDGPNTKASIKKLRTMHTHDIAEEYFGTEEMKRYYRDQLEAGLTATEAKKAVSEYYFGS